MDLYVGTSGYSYKQWKGGFYPDDLPDRRMLHYYGEQFRTVEINNTFYRMPAKSVLESWASQVGPDFKFVLKAPGRITHIQRLKAAEDAVAHLMSVAAVLGDRLGAVLFQLPPGLHKDDVLLRDFMAALPAGGRAAFEFRHPSWFDDQTFDTLRSHQAALCIAQADDGLDVPVVATADWGYLRLRNLDYTDAELTGWLERLRAFAWRDAFVFFKHEDEAKGPRLARRMLELAESPQFAEREPATFDTGRHRTASFHK